MKSGSLFPKKAAREGEIDDRQDLVVSLSAREDPLPKEDDPFWSPDQHPCDLGERVRFKPRLLPNLLKGKLPERFPKGRNGRWVVPKKTRIGPTLFDD